jgi:hypothetical protein
MATYDDKYSLQENPQIITEENENQNGILIHNDTQLPNIEGEIQNKAEEKVVNFKSSKILLIMVEIRNRLRRRSKNLTDGRNYKCDICFKAYLSYPALYTHLKSKHKIISSIKDNRGKKEPILVVL